MEERKGQEIRITPISYINTLAHIMFNRPYVKFI